ncbi:MAG: hypothetical protein GHHEDOFH_00856 [Pseudorhodoplanes sp.]|nr:hypothetical protein [Pseudorhodoplanes sp.]
MTERCPFSATDRLHRRNPSHERGALKKRIAVAADLLETTRQADLQPLVAPSGVAVFQNFSQIRAELKRKFSEEHIRLFAQPNADPATGDVQWYSPVGGIRRRLSELDSKTRARVEAKLAPLINEISTHADQLQKSGNEIDRLMGSNLAQALEIPSEDHIFVVEDQPIIAAWGHVPRGPATPIRLLMALADRALNQPQIPDPLDNKGQTRVEEQLVPANLKSAAQAQIQRSLGRDGDPARYRLVVSSTTFRSLPFVSTNVAWLSTLLWALFILILFIIGYLLLKYCAIGWPVARDDIRHAIINFCDGPAVIASVPAVPDNPRQGALLDKLRQLERSIEEKRRACAVDSRRNADSTRRPADGRSRVEREGGRIGAVNLILTWNTDDDLDLHVRCPDGSHIYFANQRSCGAVLDVDRNMSQNTLSVEPVENIYWDEAGAAPGEYVVEVDRYKSRSSGSQTSRFRIELRINGRQVEVRDGTIEGEKSPKQVFTFKLPYGPR